MTAPGLAESVASTLHWRLSIGIGGGFEVEAQTVFAGIRSTTP